MLQRSTFSNLIFFLFLLFLPLPAMAISTVNLSFVGNDAYLLSGANLEDVAKIEVTVSYDSSLLCNPRLVPRSYFDGATVSLEGDTGGTARLTVTSTKPMRGNGPFAALAFDPVGTSVGFINSLTGRVYDTNGASLAVIFAVTNPTPQLDPSDPDDLPMIKEREAKGQTFMGGDVSYMPPEATDAKERGEQSETTAETKDAAAATGKSTAAQSADFQESQLQEKAPESSAPMAQSILERFRLFKGKRSAKNLTALFDAAPAAFFRQYPAIFLADGKGSVRVIISRVAPGKAPNFAFRSARCVSFRKVSETEWLVEARPDKGVLKAGIMLLDDGKPREIPLTVARKARVDLISPGKVSEADFALFLKERGTARAPCFDLNGDGKRDYLDDYIFTANYLLAREKEKAKAVVPPASLKTQKTQTEKQRPSKGV